jgi:hypothetical protein
MSAEKSMRVFMYTRTNPFRFTECEIRSYLIYHITNTQWTGFLFILLHGFDDCGPPPIIPG